MKHCPCEVRIKESLGLGGLCRRLLKLSGSTVKSEQGTPKPNAHPRRACRTASEKESELLYLTEPTPNTFALLIVFNA